MRFIANKIKNTEFNMTSKIQLPLDALYLNISIDYLLMRLDLESNILMQFRRFFNGNLFFSKLS